MPIKDRTRRRLVRLGTIRLGIQVPNSRGNGTHPVQTDYFVLRDAPELIEVYGEQPRELDVLLPFPDIDRNFTAFYQVWAGGVLVCKGDGEYVQYATPHRVEVKKNKKDVERTHVYNGKGDTLVSDGVAAIAFDWNGEHFDAGDHVPCPGKAKDFYPHCAACKLGCLLKVMMADRALFRMGYYQISTGSVRNHDTILGMLEAFPADRVNSVPFKLRLVQEQITYNENGERKKTNKWFLQLEPDPTITRQLYSRMASALLGETPKPAALPGPGPDWDSLSADAPEPPPFVVEGKDASSDEYYAGDLSGNGYLEGELEPTPDPKLEPWANIAMPDGIENAEHLALVAVGPFPFEHTGEAMSALLQASGTQWKKESLETLWASLNTWFASKQAEVAAEAGDG